MKFIIIFVAFATVHSRPQILDGEETISEKERQKQDKITKDILEKIAEVNKNQGLVPAKKKQSYFHFPFSYTRESSDFKNRSVLNEELEDDYLDAVETDELEPQITKKITHVQTFGVPMNPYNVNPYNVLPYNNPSYNNPSFGMPQLVPENTAPPEITNEIDFKNALEQAEQLPIRKQTIVKHEVVPLFPPPLAQSESTPRQNWNWPGAQYFPIIIKDPFIQMYQAITTMIEYGPMAGAAGGNACKGKLKDGRNPKSKPDDETILDIEGIHIAADEEERDGRSRENKVENLFEQPKKKNAFTALEQLKKRNELFNLSKANISVETTSPIGSPPNRAPGDDFDVGDDEDDESSKAEDIMVSNDHAKKVFSKDNTGNGIFIHRLKVKMGGVAIAGPGGIATAGSGGTAIVGPNGYAYTHPDSLAIAGSGSKVIALEPNVNLLEALQNHKNESTRMGKVVATGPVIYYNKG